jgi:uncharacterized protein YijF (DUF1287 family)
MASCSRPQWDRRKPVLVLATIGLLTHAELLGATDFTERLSNAALERTRHRVIYDGGYRPIPFPGGDVPEDRGVCSDVVIRAYRGIGVDLQFLVHEDMAANFSAYPSLWGLSRPDPNIDHRRVPNLQRFFERRGQSLSIGAGAEYRPGDLVTWRLPGNRPHIGILVNRYAPGDSHPLVVHNIGAGPRLEDVLWAYPRTGHYRFTGESADTRARAPPAR